MRAELRMDHPRDAGHRGGASSARLLRNARAAQQSSASKFPLIYTCVRTHTLNLQYSDTFSSSIGLLH